MPDTDTLALARSRRLVLGEILARNARKHPDKAALVFEGTSLSFAQLDERVNRLANGLGARGVEAGSNVAVLMYNRLEVIESYLACHKLGACPVPVNFRLALDEVRYILGDSEAVAVLCDDTLEPLALEAASGGLVVSTATSPRAGAEQYEAVLDSASAEAPSAVVEEDDLAFLMYTSGTTGRPKGAMLTHRNLVTNTSNWIIEMEAGTEDVWLSGLPLFHIGGINGILPFLYTGGTSVITPSTNFDPQESLDLLSRHAATMCYFVPTQWQQICQLPGIGDVDTSRLRKALWGASQAPRSTLELLTGTFPSVGIVNAFGQTEMSSNTCFLKPADAVRKMGSVGRPAVNVEARIVDDEMNDVPPGEVGEIVYRGPTVMRGYWRNDSATAEAFAGGWFHSGDLVVADDEGFITVVDRKKDMIISGGENIYPAEVEAVLMQHEAVADVTVVGVAHPKWVETPVAIVVLAEGRTASEDELIEFTKTRLASYKKPSAVRFSDMLPRNAAGKVLRRELRDTYSGLFAEAPA